MVGELEIAVIPASGAAFVAIDDLDQVPMQAGLIRSEALREFGDVEYRPATACQAVDG